MMEKSLIKSSKSISEARKILSPEQINFAEWLALPSFERIPKKQQELAAQLHVTEQTLCNWKKLPEIWQVRDEAMDSIGKELVPEAIGTLKNMMQKGNTQQAFQAAKEILDRYAEPIKHLHVITSLKDLWEAYHQ